MPTAPINAQYQVDMDCALVPNGQDYAANTSRVYARLIVRKLSGTGYWALDGQPWSINFGGHLASGTYTYDFRNYTELIVWQDTITHTHNPDGTRTIDYSGTAAMASPPGGSATASGQLVLPRIPRGPRVNDGGPWRHTVAYINDNGAWRIAIPYVNDNGAWRIGGS